MYYFKNDKRKKMEIIDKRIVIHVLVMREVFSGNCKYWHDYGTKRLWNGL